MIKINEKIKYLFKNQRYMMVSDEDDSREVRLDKLVFINFKKCEIPQNIKDEDWDLIHLDGDLKNCSLDNLELVIFEKEDIISKLEALVSNLKNELSEKTVQIKELILENHAKDGKVRNIHSQVLYEQGRIKELNKELRKKECEIRRLMALKGVD